MYTNFRYLLLTLAIICGFQITSYSQQLSTDIESLSKGVKSYNKILSGTKIGQEFIRMQLSRWKNI
jgi:hypothetical protein